MTVSKLSTPDSPRDRIIQGANSQIQAVLDYCVDQVERLVELWYLEEVLSEEEILTDINEYMRENGDNINDFLWSTGKAMIAMNSAEKFWDIFIEKLGLSPDRVSKIKISTYSEMQSSWADISDESKTEILEKMWLTKGDKVLIIEDMIDSGNTLKRLVDFMESLWVEVKIICLFDKQTEESSEVKEVLGDRLSSIKSVENRFILGFWMDYEERMFADIPWLYQVVAWKEMDFTKEVTIEQLTMIREIIKQRDELLALVEKPIHSS